jgi:hypothetical protein
VKEFAALVRWCERTGKLERLSEMHPKGFEKRMQTTWGGNWYGIQRRRRRLVPTEERSVFKLAAEDAKNLDNAVKLLGDTYDIITDLEDLHDRLPYLCLFPDDADKNDVTFAAGLNASLMMICRRQLTLGTLTLLRGYRNDHLLHLRRALETCAVAARMGKHPHMARLWIEAGNDDEAFERFRNKFVKLFPDDDPQLKKLGEQYDVCSKAMHSGIYGVANYLAPSRLRPSTSLVSVFDVGTDAKLVATFMASVAFHLIMLRIFERLLTPNIGERMKTWASELSAVEVKARNKHEYWKPLVEVEARRLKERDESARQHE